MPASSERSISLFYLVCLLHVSQNECSSLGGFGLICWITGITCLQSPNHLMARAYSHLRHNSTTQPPALLLPYYTNNISNCLYSVNTTHKHKPFYSSVDFVRDNPGELVPEGTFRHLMDFLVQNEDNTRDTPTIRIDCHPSRLIGAPSLPSPPFSLHYTNNISNCLYSVKLQKNIHSTKLHYWVQASKETYEQQQLQHLFHGPLSGELVPER